MLGQLRWKQDNDINDNNILLKLNRRKPTLLYYDHSSAIIRIVKFDPNYLLLTTTSDTPEKLCVENYYISQIENVTSRILALFKFPVNFIVSENKKILIKSKNGMSYEKTGTFNYPMTHFKFNHQSLDEWKCSPKYSIMLCNDEGHPISFVVGKWQTAKSIKLSRKFFFCTYGDNFETLQIKWRIFKDFIHNQVTKQYRGLSHRIADNFFLPKSREYDPKKILEENPLLLTSDDYELYAIKVPRRRSELRVKAFNSMTKREQKSYWEELYRPYNTDKKILEVPVGLSESATTGLMTLEENERLSLQSIVNFEKYDIKAINSQFGKIKKDTKVGFVVSYVE